jgi:hypothetical protein
MEPVPFYAKNVSVSIGKFESARDLFGMGQKVALFTCGRDFYRTKNVLGELPHWRCLLEDWMSPLY